MTARLTIVIRMMALMTIMYSDSEDTPYMEVVRNYPLLLSQSAYKGNMGGPARDSIGLLLRNAHLNLKACNMSVALPSAIQTRGATTPNQRCPTLYMIAGLCLAIKWVPKNHNTSEKSKSVSNSNLPVGRPHQVDRSLASADLIRHCRQYRSKHGLKSKQIHPLVLRQRHAE